ncbi:hypothetical protein [Achromobacter anxifer]
MSIAIAVAAPNALHTPSMRRSVIAGATIGVGFLMRPAGSMLIGSYANRTHDEIAAPAA